MSSSQKTSISKEYASRTKDQSGKFVRPLGRYISIGTSIMIRVPGHKQVSMPLGKDEEAMALRDELAAKNGIALTGPIKKTNALKLKKGKNATNKELPVGVSPGFLQRETPTGIHVFEYFAAIIRVPVVLPNGQLVYKNKTKHFYCKKLGKDEAKRRAIEWRETMREKYYIDE